MTGLKTAVASTAGISLLSISTEAGLYFFFGLTMGMVLTHLIRKFNNVKV